MATVRSAIVGNPYARLGLAPGAPFSDVKRAYRRLAMQFHPDRAGSSNLQSFLAVKAAYESIVDRSSLGLPGDRRPGSVRRTTVPRPVRRGPTMGAPPPPPAARSSWPGGRWYWEGMRARAAQR
jgi:curved DNA-binding protein CbpA